MSWCLETASNIARCDANADVEEMLAWQSSRGGCMGLVSMLSYVTFSKVFRHGRLYARPGMDLQLLC